jgi:hypothetical protein
MPSASFTISGKDWTIKDQFGNVLTTDETFAILQAPAGQEPWRYNSIYQMQFNVVDFSVNYSAATRTISSIQPFTTSFDTPMFLWMNPSINGSWSQGGMYQISSILDLNNPNTLNVDLNQGYIKDVMGIHYGLTFTTTDYTTWNGVSAVPEPSYAPMAGGLLILVMALKLFKKPKEAKS